MIKKKTKDIQEIKNKIKKLDKTTKRYLNYTCKNYKIRRRNN